MKVSSKHSTSSRAVRRNALWNIFGQGLPLVVAVFFIPRLIAGIGTERFGALTLVWAFLSYFGLFDLGIGRSLTQLLAGRVQDDKKEEAALIWTVSLLLGILGLVAALVCFLLAPVFTSRLLHLQGSLQTETTLALRELGLALPFLIHSVALKGILEARRRFDLSNLVRIPLGVFVYLAPLLVIPFSHNLGVIVAVLLAGRIVAWLATLWMIFRIMPHLSQMMRWEPGRIKELMLFGGWFTVSSVVGPIIDNMDRFFINAILSISMVAYYTTPFEICSKSLIIPMAIGGALFPEFAARFHRNPGEAQALFMRGFKYLLALLFPAMLIATAYAHEGLTLWLNPDFALQSGTVLQWLLVYMLLSSLTQIFFAFLLGVGRPALPASLHLLELPLYAVLLYFLLKLYGIRGAAIAAVLRIAFDFFGQLFFCGYLLRFKLLTYAKILLPLGAVLVILFCFHAAVPPILKASLVSILLVAYACAFWVLILESDDKTLVLRMLGKR